jgi:hypothetical protein
MRWHTQFRRRRVERRAAQSITCAPVTPHWWSANVEVNSRSTVRRAITRPSAGAHIATGANTPHAGECTVHPIEADTTAIALVAPTDIPTKVSKGRQGVIGMPQMRHGRRPCTSRPGHQRALF